MPDPAVLSELGSRGVPEHVKVAQVVAIEREGSQGSLRNSHLMRSDWENECEQLGRAVSRQVVLAHRR